MGRSFFVVALVGLLLTGRAWSQECSQTIEANDQIQYNKKEIKVAKSCKEFTLTLKHVGMLAANVMGHNWVLAKTSDYQALARQAKPRDRRTTFRRAMRKSSRRRTRSAAAKRPP